MSKRKGKINGKQKGNNYERIVANLLSNRFKDYLGVEQGFYRLDDSGSYFGGSNEQRMNTHLMDHAVFGDIVYPKSFRFTIECKNYGKDAAPSFQTLIKGTYKQWDDWLIKAMRDGHNANKDWLLIIRYSYIPDIIVMKENYVKNTPYEPIFRFKYYFDPEDTTLIFDTLSTAFQIDDDFWFIE